jgi:lipid-A-disaccharide synthase-like uncharacterized protein
VKKIKFFLFTLVFFLNFSLQAQVDTQDVSSAEMTPAVVTNLELGPFKLDVSADYVGSAKVDHPHEYGDLTFATAMGEGNFIFYYNKCYEEGAAVALVYEYTYLDLTHNPYFAVKNFSTVTLLLSGFTERIEDWEWRGQLSVNFDNVPHWNFNDYMNYDILVWGRYKYCEDVGVHIGFFVQTGMKYDRVYPVVGVDWTCNPSWKFNLIFPLNISAIYTINSHWNVALAARFINQRHRAEEDEPLPEAFWHYQGGGGELALNYNPSTALSVNVHAGYFCGAHLTIRNRHYHHPKRLRVDGSPYGGAEVAYHF